MKLITDSRCVARCLILALVLTFFAYVSPDFLSTGNLYSLGQDFALLGIVTLGLALTMIAGEFDLSLGAVVAVAGLLMVKFGDVSPYLGFTAAVAFGLCVGLFNAATTLLFSVSSLVTTLGSMILIKGGAVWLEGGKVVSYTNFDFTDFVDQSLGGVLSPRSLVTLFLFVLLGFVLRFTRLGRDIIATGSSRSAAKSSLVRVRTSLAVVFVLASCFAAVGGALLSASLATASSSFGSNLILQAATAAIMGGVALRGGQGSVVSIILGVLILAALNNGLSILGVHSSVVALCNGVLLLMVMFTERNVTNVISDAFLRLRSIK